MKSPLVFSDIDGTLLDDHHQLPAAVIAAVRDYAQAGGHFCLASARPPRGMTALAARLGLTLPLVSLNGALIVTEAEAGRFTTLFEQPLPTGAAAHVATVAATLPVSLNLFAGLDWCAAPSDWVTQEVAITGFAPTLRDPAALLASGRAVHKILCMGVPTAIDALADALVDQPLTLARSKPTYLEITHPAVSKRAALHAMARYFDVPMTATLAMGDGDNDLAMVQAAGTGIALANGTAALRTAATHVVAANTEAGAAQALREFAM
ncbi:Cof-type HAD-IIB family hydrolase [Lacticaseibacillus daqingensis]|uniref:Cof-type HAD-IIB family hydrolase n=1 Tax=Lacticaseibacillus daqingensis TaxID=2486014 RepID=UPI000F78C869|nr:Cof-type HAD-IIB family hydrolase [Lacticaseibacillus daqingensis]